MIAALVTAVLVSQAPAETRSPVAVVLSSQRAGAGNYAKMLSARVTATLKKQGIEVMADREVAKRFKRAGGADPKNCDGAAPCLQKLALLLGPTAVLVGVDVGKLQAQLALHVEAVSADQTASLAVADYLTQASKWASATPTIEAFAAELKPKLELPKAETPPIAPPPPPEPPPAVALADDRPEAPKLTPTAAPEEPLAAVKRAEPGPSKAVPWALAGGAAAAGIAAGTFAALGFADKAAFDASKYDVGGQTASRLTQSELNTLAASGNTKFTVALTSAVVAAGLGAAATYFFVKE